MAKPFNHGGRHASRHVDGKASFESTHRMTSLLITDQSEFDDLCLHIRKAGLVAFDTETTSLDAMRATTTIDFDRVFQFQ